MKKLSMVFVLVMFAAAPGRAQSKLNVMTATEDLAAIAREVGGDHVAVEPMARGYQDPHFVEAKPSFILRLQKADLLIVVGRELEIGWLPPLIQQSRNAKIQPGAEGYLDASQTRGNDLADNLRGVTDPATVREIVRRIFIETAQYQAVASAVS